jgi:acyl-CoA synthetase (AMP-forming)/AMP-acid ligase II
MISHANLAANLSAIISSLQAGRDTVVASWLPQYHDMGLIGAYLGAIYCGGSGRRYHPPHYYPIPVQRTRLVRELERMAGHIKESYFFVGMTRLLYFAIDLRPAPILVDRDHVPLPGNAHPGTDTRVLIGSEMSLLRDPSNFW